MTTPFNSALETGIRSLAILNAVFPRSLDLQHLIDFDYFVVHTGDVNGPDSLHVPLPMRSGELLVRRGLIERGLLLMISRGLVERLISPDGFQYIASDEANAFLSMLASNYTRKLKARAEWVAENFGDSSFEEIQQIKRQFFGQWSTQFQAIEQSRGFDR